MNVQIDSNEVQKGLECLDVVYKAAMAGTPTGLVPAAVAAQQNGINEAAQAIADLMAKLSQPVISSQDEVEVLPPEMGKAKPAKK